MINNLLPIQPCLYALASRMTGAEFVTFTAHVRDHLVLGDSESCSQLSKLLIGHKVESSQPVLGQIVAARHLFFGEVPSQRLLSNMRKFCKSEDDCMNNFLNDVESALEEAKMSPPLPAALVNLMHTVEFGQYEDDRLAAVQSLALLRHSEAVWPLAMAVTYDKSWRVQCEAAKALGQLGEMKAIIHLTKALSNENEEVRKAAAAAIKKIRGT